MKEAIHIPVQSARDLADKFDKDIVIVIGLDTKTGTIYSATYGKSPIEKQVASDLGQHVVSFLGGDLSRKTTFEDPAGLMGEKV